VPAHPEARWLVVWRVSIAALLLFHMATFDPDIDFRTAMGIGVIRET
jgi:hypothetical protein